MNALSFKEKPQKVWILAGEASGDLYGARLAEELQRQHPQLLVQGMGADRMREAGVEILVDSTDLGIVGFVEVLKHLPMFWRLFHQLVDQAAEARPDVVVLIDYPGFNLRFARKMKELEIPVVYYVSPQIWAWGKNRVKTMVEFLSHMIVIFPFEKRFYERSRLPVSYVGHPMVQILKERQGPETQRANDLIALLPGSRMSELSRLLVPFLETAARIYQRQPRYRFVIPLPTKCLCAYVQEQVLELWSDEGTIPIEVTHGETERWLSRATAGLAASGTVTVQAAILGLPLVVAYKVNAMTYFIGKRLINVPYITMVNLVAEEEIYEEYVQSEATPEKLAEALFRILPDGERRQSVIDGIQATVRKLRGEGNPSAAAASIVLEQLAAPEDSGPG